jgi:hypothetical protein
MSSLVELYVNRDYLYIKLLGLALPISRPSIDVRRESEYHKRCLGESVGNDARGSSFCQS